MNKFLEEDFYQILPKLSHLFPKTTTIKLYGSFPLSPPLQGTRAIMQSLEEERGGGGLITTFSRLAFNSTPRQRRASIVRTIHSSREKGEKETYGYQPR